MLTLEIAIIVIVIVVKLGKCSELFGDQNSQDLLYTEII